MKYGVAGVMNVSVKPKMKYYVDKDTPDKVQAMLDADLKDALQVGWQALQSYCREREEAGEDIPSFVNSSMEDTLSTRRLK